MNPGKDYYQAVTDGEGEAQMLQAAMESARRNREK